jgi:CRISPR/Cas system CSM-associated protein Csm4 (group 5 of RAMP superfamily)
MKDFKLKLSDKKVTEQEIRNWERKVKQLNVSNSFNGRPVLSNEEFLSEVLNFLQVDFERLHRGFLIHSDTWTYSETEAWTKKYNQTTESVNLHMRLYFLYTGQDFKFSI